MKMPQAGVMAPAGSIENYADDWKDPAKTMVLRYDTIDPATGQPFVAIPQRLEAPGIAPGFIEAANSSVNDIRASMGMYQAALGEQGPEVSGVAIKARTIQSDVATYHFGDNLVHSITQVGRIIIGAVPAIYDTPRLEQIINDEDSPEMVGLNGLTVEGQEAIHNVQTGKYGVRVTVGASYTTRRQEAEKFYSELVQSNPQLLSIMGDLLFKYSDFEGAQQLSARMKKTMNPMIVNDDNKVDPQVVALTQQLQQAQGIIQALQAQLKDKTTDQQIKAAQVAGHNQNAENQHHLAIIKTATDALQNERELDIKEQGTAADIVLEAGKILHKPMATVNKQMQGIEHQLPHTSTNTGGVV